VQVGEEYMVVSRRPLRMGLEFGLLDNGLYVVMSENGKPYFEEKETKHE
jgi:hypothetical protein